ncbi:MAG: hypothetical protein WBD67_03295 [Terracidiphilus sp.]
MKMAITLATAFCAACLTSPAAAAAQTAQSALPNQPRWTSPSMSALLRMMPAPTCPVRMDLRSSFQFAPIFVGDGTTVQGPNLRLQLILTNPNGDRVVRARLTVDGWSDKPQVVPVNGAAAGAGQTSGGMSRTVEAMFAPGSAGTSEAELDLHGFSAFRLVRLEEVTFASGAAWKFDSMENCQAASNPLVLVTAR